MKIDILTNDGSPLGVSEASIYGQDGRMGVGGAELALLTLCKAWHDAGHEVALYNDPDIPDGSAFVQRPMDEFSPKSPRDVLIIFRSPNARIQNGATGLKVWWSTDQRTIGNFSEFSEQVDKIVTISPYHSQYFLDVYGIDNTIPIDLPVRTWEYTNFRSSKTPYRCIYNSMPDRGVEKLAPLWGRIVKEVPEASLVITSDWRLWSKQAKADAVIPYKTLFSQHPNVVYRGALNRMELVQQELMAQVHLYPCTYEELFCISVAETQVAGAYPVTSNCGAVRSTNMGKVIEGTPGIPEWDAQFVEYAVELLLDQKQLKQKAMKLKSKAKQRFSIKKILGEWNNKVFV